MKFVDVLTELTKIANKIDMLGFKDEAVSIDVVAEKVHELSLINHKEDIEKELVIKWAEYNRVANELRSVEEKIREKDVRRTRAIYRNSRAETGRFN